MTHMQICSECYDARSLSALWSLPAVCGWARDPSVIKPNNNTMQRAHEGFNMAELKNQSSWFARHTAWGWLSSIFFMGVLSLANEASAQLLGISQCLPGTGVDYQVGAGKTYPTLKDVPWPNLGPGDTVRIFYSATPHKGKFLITAKGTPTAPVRICGVKGPNGERPIIDGKSAVTRLGMVYGNSPSVSLIHQERSVIVIKNIASDFFHFPENIQIDGLVVTGAHPAYQFTDVGGVVRSYTDFGACIWVDRGHNITIADNEIHDCSQGLYSKGSDDYLASPGNGQFSMTKNLRVAGNIFSNIGIVGAIHEHSSYTASLGTVIEYNRYRAMRTGAMGNSIKDRSIGTVVRYNRIEDGARAIDLVEAEDFPETALADPAYRKTFVYGNQIIKDGDLGSTIHYGGDHNADSTPTSNYGIPFNRKGNLYVFNNTIRLTGTGVGVLFQLSTTEETAHIWNNIFMFDPGIQYPSMRSDTDLGAGSVYTAGGIVNLGKNWIVSNWGDTDEFHTIPGQLNGSANMFSTGTGFPVDPVTFLPVPNSVIINAGTAPPAAAAAAVAAHPVDRQLDSNFQPKLRAVLGSAIDIGAVETLAPPSAPTNVVATAGNGSATISFTPPTSSGGSGITSYEVVCNPGNITVTGASPVLVTGLANATAYSCTVAAYNSEGRGTLSAVVNVTPSAAAAFTLVSVRSRKSHGTAGTFDLPIDPVPAITGAITVEPRQASGGTHTVVFQFSGPVTAPGTLAVTDTANAMIPGATHVQSGNNVVVTLTGIADKRRAKIALTNVNGAAVSPSASIGFMVGDVNGSRAVNASDIAGLKAQSSLAVGIGNFKYDLNLTGTLNAQDISVVKSRSGTQLP